MYREESNEIAKALRGSPLNTSLTRDKRPSEGRSLRLAATVKEAVVDAKGETRKKK